MGGIHETTRNLTRTNESAGWRRVSVFILVTTFSVWSWHQGSTVGLAQIVDHVVQLSIDGLHSGHLENLLLESPDEYPNFNRLVREGVSTFNARTDFGSPYTLPNHTSMMTGRPAMRACSTAASE